MGKKSKKHLKKKIREENKKPNVLWWLDTHKKTWLILIFAANIVTGVVHFSTELSTIGDNALFVVLGQSLAEGHGYEEINSPTPHGHTKYPFGFPALLALFYHIFHLNPLGYKIVVFLLSVAALFFLYKWFDDLPVLLLFSFFLMTALNLKILEYSSLILSEIPFLFFVSLGFYLFKRFDLTTEAKYFALGIFSFGIAYYMRSIGLVLFPALMLYLLFKKEYKWLIVTLFATVIIIAPWQIWTSMHGGASYFKQLRMKDPYSPALGTVGFSYIISERIPANFNGYFFTFLPETIFTVFKAQPFELRGLLAAILSISVLTGFVFDFWKKWDLKGWYFLGTAAVVLLWPEVWMGERFIFGVIPLIVYYFVYFIYRIMKFIINKEMTQIYMFFRVTILLSIILIFMQFKFENPQMRYSPDWVNYKQSMVWLKFNSSKDAVIACRKPTLGYIWSGRKTVGIPHSSDKKRVYNSFKSERVNYLVYDGFYWSTTTRRYMGPVIQKNQRDFPIVYALNNPPTYVLEFRADNP